MSHDMVMLYALAALGDTDAVLELGHFGNETTKDAIKMLKYCRADIKARRERRLKLAGKSKR